MHRMPRNLLFFSFYLRSSFFTSFFIYFLATAPPSELIIDHDIVSFFVHLDPFAFRISTLVWSVCNNKIGPFMTRTWFPHRSKHFSSLCRVLWLRSKEWIYVCLWANNVSLLAWYRFLSVRGWYEWAIGGYDSTGYVINWLRFKLSHLIRICIEKSYWWILLREVQNTDRYKIILRYSSLNQIFFVSYDPTIYIHLHANWNLRYL